MNQKPTDGNALYRCNEILDTAWEGLEKPLHRRRQVRGFPGFALRRTARVLPALIADPGKGEEERKAKRDAADAIGLDALSQWIRSELAPWLQYAHPRTERLAWERLAIRLDGILQELLRDASRSEEAAADAIPSCSSIEIRLAIAIIALDFLHTTGAETSFRIADIEETLSVWRNRIAAIADPAPENDASLPFRRLVTLAKNLSARG